MEPNIKLTFSIDSYTLRPLLPTDVKPLTEFLSSLSATTRLHYVLPSYDLATATEFCQSIGKYDKLRFILLDPTPQIVGLFEFSFDLTQADLDRYRQYGLALTPGQTLRFGPCLADQLQGRGVATRVFSYILKIAHHFHQKRLILWGGVFEDNFAAVRYYQKVGFQLAGNFYNSQNRPCLDFYIDL